MTVPPHAIHYMTHFAVVRLFSKSLLNDLDTVLSGHDNCGGHIKEEAVLNYPNHLKNFLCCRIRVLDRFLKVQIDNVVIIVSNVGFVTLHSQLCIASGDRCCPLELVQSELPAEWSDFNRHGTANPKSWDLLGIIYDDDELLGLNFYHFFTKKGSSAALHQVKVVVVLVSPVNGHVKNWVGVQGDKRDVKTFSLLLRSNRRGDCNNILEFSRLQLFSESLHGEISSGSSS
mmetsp:Transcript_40593/g.160996  ORF Transcript_40593/g.160996 Transcript_40593/m.160996 type:complete len:230 (-) Transcript_40593:414-1103(-)